MVPSFKRPFSVAKSATEDAGEGAAKSISAPPRISSTQTSHATDLQPRFGINPFSLSRNSLLKSQISPPSSHRSVNSCILSPVSVPSCISSSKASVNISKSPLSAQSSFSSHASSLFPNPFLLNRDLDLQTAPEVPIKAVENSIIPSTSTQSLRDANRPSTLPISHTSFIPPLVSSLSTTSSTRKPRKPRPDRVLIPSSLRPRVMAVDRLFSWRTPYGLSHDESLLAELPPALVESAKISIMGALATSSRSTYAAGLLRFNQFCDKWLISEGARMPASYALLCAFIGNHKGTTSGKTIKSWLSGIRAWHLTNHAPWYGDDKWVQMARISANKEGSRHKRALRAPVSIEHLLVLLSALTLSISFHAAVWAVALVTFFGCRRLGETTVSSISAFDPSLHVLRSAEYVYTLLYSSFSLHYFLVFPLSPYGMAHGLPLSVSLGRKLLAKKAPLLFSLPVMTNSAPAQPYEITLKSIAMHQEQFPYSLMSPLTDAGNT